MFLIKNVSYKKKKRVLESMHSQKNATPIYKVKTILRSLTISVSQLWKLIMAMVHIYHTSRASMYGGIQKSTFAWRGGEGGQPKANEQGGGGGVLSEFRTFAFKKNIWLIF